jgi:hypothetical protein
VRVAPVAAGGIARRRLILKRALWHKAFCVIGLCTEYLFGAVRIDAGDTLRAAMTRIFFLIHPLFYLDIVRYSAYT